MVQRAPPQTGDEVATDKIVRLYKISLARIGNILRNKEIVSVGYESSEMARRRLGAWVVQDAVVWQSLAPTPAPALGQAELDAFMRTVLAEPGAAGALLATLAVQVHALNLVWEAERRGVGTLPADVVAAVRSAVEHVPGGWAV